MKFTKIAAAAVAVSTLAGSAFAADLPSRKAPVMVPPPPPVFTWAGFYVGLNVGYIDGPRTTSVGYPIANDGTAGAAFPGSQLAAAGMSSYGIGQKGGVLGGVQAGYNWQFGSAVLGLEADFDGAGVKNRGVFGGIQPFTGFAGFSQESIVNSNTTLNWIGTVRGRIGYSPFAPILIYATGGLAYGQVKTNIGYYQLILPPGACGPCNGASSALSMSGTRVGWTAGAGVEWMVWQNVSLKGEVLYYDLGKQNGGTVMYNPNVGAGTIFTTTGAAVRTRTDGIIARAGINYHFNWGAPMAPVVARY